MKQTTVLHLPPSEGNPRNSEGSFAELKDGRILFIYGRYTGKIENWGDSRPCNLVARISQDQGRTWSSSERMIISHEDALNVMSPSLLRLQDGRLALLYLRKSMDEAAGILSMPHLVFSDDEGESWTCSQESIIPAKAYYVVNNDRMIQLESGRIIIPVSWHRLLNRDSHDSRAIGLMYLSDDNGSSFHEAADWMLPPQHCASGLQENGVIALGGNHLTAYFRTDLGRHYKAFSTDGGIHWSIPAPSEFQAPCSPLSIKRNPSTGELFAIWNDRSPRWQHLPPPQASSWGRTPLVLARSLDNGATWQDHALLADDPARGYCYTAMHFTRDNALLLSFCCGGADGTSVLQETKILRLEL